MILCNPRRPQWHVSHSDFPRPSLSRRTSFLEGAKLVCAICHADHQQIVVFCGDEPFTLNIDGKTLLEVKAIDFKILVIENLPLPDQKIACGGWHRMHQNHKENAEQGHISSPRSVHAQAPPKALQKCDCGGRGGPPRSLARYVPCPDAMSINGRTRTTQAPSRS